MFSLVNWSIRRTHLKHRNFFLEVTLLLNQRLKRGGA